MKKIIFIALVFTVSLTSCSYLPGSDKDGEKRMVDAEEITVVEIYISKQRAHCEDKSGKTLDDTKSELESESIRVFSSACGVITGKMAPTFCGDTTLHINIHGIDQRKIPSAEALGYQAVASFSDNLGYETLSCDGELE